jgi:hypothetical protein
MGRRRSMRVKERKKERKKEEKKRKMQKNTTWEEREKEEFGGEKIMRKQK